MPELAREIGVSEATIYTWKSKYGGMEVNDAQKLKALEDENRNAVRLPFGLSAARASRRSAALGLLQDGCGPHQERGFAAGVSR